MIGIYLTMKERQVYIYRETIRELGNPAFFRFLLNPEKRKFAIEVCALGDPGYYTTPVLEDDRYRVNSIKLLRLIWNLCEWDEDRTYRVPGVVYHKENIAEFLLDEAEPVNTPE